MDCASAKYAELAKKCDVAGLRINPSLDLDEAIDTVGNRWQAMAIHRDRLRDRPEEAGATGWAACMQVRSIAVPNPAGTCASTGRWL
jgi:hypothetical protein